MSCFFSKDFSKNAFTSVENEFIREYLPLSSGDSAKVYLYGLFLCQNPELDLSLKEIAERLNMKEEDVLNCFSFWEDFGVLSVLSKEPLSIQYLPVKTTYSSKPRKFNAEKYTEFTKSLQALLPSRMISTSEYSEYFNIMETFKIEPDAMLMIVKYCIEAKGKSINYRYVSTVARDYGERHVTTVEKVEKELQNFNLRSIEIERVLSAMSVKKKPELEELNLYKKWTLELGFEPENIIFAAKNLKKGNFNKLDSFILELYSKKSFTKDEIKDYVDKKQQIYDLTLRINKALSVYVDIIDTEIDTYVNKWLSFGFTESALIFIASELFKEGKNTLKSMDETIEDFKEKGVIDLSSVGDYFESVKKDDSFISKMLSVSGINRRPTSWDRNNLILWKSWNFSEEMILEAAKLSAGKSNPVSYMYGILSKWKNQNTFDVSTINSSSVSSQEEYNLEYERRREKAIFIAQKNYEKAMELQGFPEIYSRLNSIEKDLAFSEIANNKEALLSFEKEKEELLNNAKNLLDKINLDISDLSPKYFCEKCKDTGYVKNSRCDCFSKYKK